MESSEIQSQVIVLGAGIAGLLAAKVAAAHGLTVTILERDTLQSTTAPRPGAAQGHHAHILLKRGLMEFEAIVPGFREQMLAHDGVITNATYDWYSLFPMGPLPRFVSDIDFVCASRGSIELTLRELVQTDPRIRIAAEYAVQDVKLSKIHGPVVQCRHPGGASVTFKPELVVDATGRNSKVPEWLNACSFPPARREVVRSYLGYATRIYEQLKLPAKFKGLVIMAKPGVVNRGGVLFPIDSRHYICTLYGFSKDYPPLDEKGFLEFAHSLRSPLIYNALLNAAPASDIRAFRKDESHFCHYGDRSWPLGFLVTGDAVSSFNPIYGQGMTSAALAAQALYKYLKNRTEHEWSRRAQRAITHAFQEPWKTAKTEDLRFPRTEFSGNGLVPRLEQHIGDLISLAASKRDSVAKEYVKVLHMVSTNTSLLRPGVLFLVVAALVYQKAIDKE